MVKKVFVSLLVWTVGTFLTVLLYIVMLFLTVLTAPFDRQRRLIHAQCFWWSDAVIAMNPYWHVTVKGLDVIDPAETYVIVANHQSLADIVILYQTRMQFKWVAKESLFKVPVIGWNLSLARHISLARGDFSSIKEVYRKAARWLQGGMSVLFFPEGTRSKDGSMQEFQNGAFKLAIKEKRPVLPIAVRGTGDAIPKGTWLFTPQTHCSITVLPPIPTADLGPGDFGRLRDLAHTYIRTAG